MMYNAAQLTYLEHLGIDVWVPKDVPVSALEVTPQVNAQPVQPAVNPFESPSEIPVHYEDVPATYEQPVTAQAPVAQTVAAPAVANQTAPMVPPNVQSALSSSLAAPAFPKTSQEAKTKSTGVPAVAFHVQFWCYSSGVWFISGDVNVTPEQHKLVHNLAHFIQRKKRKPRHVNVFSWPMIDSPNVDQGAEVANKYLLTHIERLQDACQQTQVFVFNDCHYYPANLPHVKLDTTLAALLVNPQGKKALWQQLLVHQLPE